MRVRARRLASFLFALIALAGFLLLPAGCSAISSTEEPTPTPIPTPIVPIQPTYRVQRGEVVRHIQFTGRIAPVLEQALFFRVGGRVRHVFISDKDLVTAGQVLADLETNNSEYDLKRAEVNLQIAQLNLEQAKAQAASPDRQYQVAIKELEVQLAQIALDEIKAAIADTQITAPFDGQVLSVILSEGYSVDAFKPAIMVADPSQLEVSADVHSAELLELAEGLPASVVLVGRPGEEITGAIRRLPYPYGAGGQSTGVADDDPSTRVSLDRTAAEAGYELGDVVRVSVILERKPDVLWLPPQAIRIFDGRTFVVVQDGEGQRRVDVTLGLESEERDEIVEGLSEGQVVVGP